MKIKCISNINCKYSLTIGKIYDNIRENEYCYIIIDDTSDECWYDKIYFKTLSEIRNEKINKLLVE